jgi:hypothetical protein
MTNDKFNLRLTKQERELLKKIVCKNGITITEYIRQKLFFNNSDISDAAYECPAKDKRDYLNARTLQDIHLVILHLIAENKTSDEIIEIKARCRDYAEKNIAKMGYLKLGVKENE